MFEKRFHPKKRYFTLIFSPAAEYHVSEHELAAIFDAVFESLLQTSSFLCVVGEAHNVPNSRLTSLFQIQSHANYKTYKHKSSQIVFVFPNLICFMYQALIDPTFELQDVLIVDTTMAGCVFKEFYGGLKRVGFRFHLVCIPPNDEKRQQLFEFFRYQKATNFEPSEEIFYSKNEGIEKRLALMKDDNISGKVLKDLASLYFKYERNVSLGCLVFYKMSEQKFTKQYYQFDESLDQLKTFRLELSKLCTNQSLCHETRQKDLKEVGLGLQLLYLLQSITYAVKSFIWNPKWAKSYKWIEKTCKAVCNIIEPYCVDGSNAGMILADLIEIERNSFVAYRNDQLLTFFDDVFLHDQSDQMKQLLKNSIQKYKQFVVSGAVEQRNVFKEEFFRKRLEAAKNSDAISSCFREARLSLYVIMKLPITNNDCYKHVIATFNEIIKQANERKQVFKSFTEDKVLSDLVLYNIGFQLWSFVYAVLIDEHRRAQRAIQP